jgi:hypothetical protein
MESTNVITIHSQRSQRQGWECIVTGREQGGGCKGLGVLFS